MDDVNDLFRKMLEDAMPKPPRYLYYEHGQHQFFWTTERCQHKGKARFMSGIYQPYGTGARTGKATRWRLTRAVGHARRKDAKARAYALYQAHQAKKEDTL